MNRTRWKKRSNVTLQTQLFYQNLFLMLLHAAVPLFTFSEAPSILDTEKAFSIKEFTRNMSVYLVYLQNEENVFYEEENKVIAETCRQRVKR